VDALLAALASSILTVVGTGLLRSRQQARELDAEADRHLRDALSEFGFALDALVLELQQLPAGKRRAVAAWKWVETHFATLDFLAARLARALFGRELYAAIERLQRATNELLLIAPPSALEALAPVFERLSSFGDRGEDWFELLQQERAAIAAASRSLIGAEPNPTKFAEEG
jgi:hypothetical protein